MARPIAYNASGPLSGSIRGGSVNYTVDGAGRDYTTFASKKWVPSADGISPIVFVTDSYTQGLTSPSDAYPLFYACSGTGSAAILYTANRVPNSPGNYSDANVALNDLITNRGYFVLESNDPFEGTYATNLGLDIDASKMTSYPQTANNWYDLSGNGNTGALTNGPTWNSNGWFTFDGVDDFVQISNAASLRPANELTIEMVVRAVTTTAGWNLLYGQNPYTGGQLVFLETGGTLIRALHYVNGTEYRCNTNESISTTVFKHVIFTFKTGDAIRSYFNGTPSTVTSLPAGTFTYNVSNPYYLSYFGANIPNIQYNTVKSYNTALTEAQVKQNYFGAPIVTDGLVFAVDANNIVSYPKSGTAWYNLTGSVASASLVNSPTFDPTNGGTIRFDGTDEYAAVQYNSSLDITNAITVEAWVKYASQGEIGGVGRTYSVISYKGYPWTWLLEDQSGQFNFRISTTNAPDSNINSGYYHGLNNWDHVVCTYNGSTQAIYVNGVLRNSQSLTGTINTSATIIELGTYGSGDYSFNGWLANHRIYNRALSASEVLQNYQATQYRFETPAGPVTNGLVLYWDAGNQDSYPGTGTTIYDLSGNGNNGTLLNGVGFNQTNGGVLTFDGIDDIVRLLAPDLRFTNNTVMGAARYTGGPGGRMINGYGNNWLMGQWATTTENYYAEGWVSTPGSGISDANWRIYSALGNVSGDSYSLYINNSLSAGPNNGGAQGPYGISIGAQGGSPGSEPSAGQFSFVLVYNRVLTTAEMTQNYNYFKGRFGL
jgi:hypothetical protein